MSSSTDLSPPWIELPREITASILQKLEVIEILTVAQNVCTTWRSVCRDPSMWRCINMGNTAYSLYDPCDFDKVCRHAVDRSRGQLVDIAVDTFCRNDLLIYISERCPRLKRLQLVYCYELYAGWSKALQNLPLLEELQLEYTSVSPDDIETIGISCPLLKTFKLSKCWNLEPDPLTLDLQAERIAQRMPQLRHLQLICNQTTNKGLQAILDGCPHLETLDVRRCYNIDFSGDIAKVCSQRIKDLRRPLDAFVDHSYPTSDDDYTSGYSDLDLPSDYGDFLEFSDGGISSCLILDDVYDPLFD